MQNYPGGVTSLLSTVNLSTVEEKKLVDKAIFKEEQNHLLMISSKHLAYFTPNLGVIKLSILDKMNKKPQMYRYRSYILDSSTNPINKLVDCELSDPAIGYGKVLEHHAAYISRLAATYPGCIVDSYDDDVSGAFPRLTHHPDINRGNISLHRDKMIVSVALHFGENYGPASREPIARARCFLAQWMFKHTTYQEKTNSEVINLMTLSDGNGNTKSYTICP